MIEVRPNKLVFPVQETKTQQLLCINNSISYILFKVKTNNIKAIDARPNQGKIAPGESIKVIVKKNISISNENIRIKLSYIPCNRPINDSNFKQIWAESDSEQKHIIVVVEESDKISDEKLQAEEDKNSLQNSKNLYKSLVNDKQQKEEAQQNNILLKSKQEQIKNQIHTEALKQKNMNENLKKIQSSITKAEEILLKSPSIQKKENNFFNFLTKPFILIPLILLAFALGYISGVSSPQSEAPQ